MVTLLPSGRAVAAVEPTDYRSVLVSVEPATHAVTVNLVGDGTFVELAVERGTEVVVVGYFEEPYLRFDADGTVAVNVRSPTSARTPVATDPRSSTAPSRLTIRPNG